MALSWWQRWLVRLLRYGAVPRHLAFIMDGNRRFARKRSNVLIAGHEAGFKTLSTLCEACAELGVEFVTVYAFALGNFFRPVEEIESLFRLAENRLQDKDWFRNTLLRHQIRVRVAGEQSFLPISLQQAAEGMERATAAHSRMALTLCIAYGSRYEMMSAALESERQLSSDNTAKGLLQLPDTTQDGITKTERDTSKGDGTPRCCAIGSQSRWLFTSELPAPDVLLRTSGETRMSDFLLYQCAEKTSIWILNVLWPELGLRHLLCCLLHYQIFSRRQSFL